MLETATHARLNRAFALAAAALVLCRPCTPAEGGTFHGLNAGAPVWNGVVQFTPQKAAQFAATGTEAVRINFRLDGGATSWDAGQLAVYDQVIQNATDAGLEVLGLFSNETVAGGQSAWNDDADGDGRNSYVDAFADTALQLVDRYKDDIKRFEVWNEPNAWTNPSFAVDPQNAGGTYILPRVYANILSETYRHLNTGGQTLLDANGVSLATGGLFAHDIGGSFTNSMPYFQQVYDQSSVWSSFQADTGRAYPWEDFGYHFYISQGTPLSQSYLASYFNTVRATKTANSDPSDIVVTEFGWQTVGSNTQAFQRDNMAVAYDYLETQPDVSGTYWYQWTDDVTGAWGIVDGAGNQKLSYGEFVARNGGPPDPVGRVVSVTEHAPNDGSLSIGFSGTDLLQGLIAAELPGDAGWHPANPAATNGSGDPNGLPAFTDGIGDTGSGLTGLLNDFLGSGNPAKKLEYDLGAPHDLEEIRVFTGNNGADGRIFSTTVVWTSTDGSDFDLLGYFQSDPSGSSNNASTPGGPDQSTLVRIFTDDGSDLAEDVTHLRFDLYAASNLEGIMLDPFDGPNAFTGSDDGLGAAFVSPLVRELDVIGTPSPADDADFDGDGDVDLLDLMVLQRGFGIGSTQAQGDANNDGVVNAEDLQAWRGQFTGSVAAAGFVPEPSAGWLALCAAAVNPGRKNRRLGTRT